MGRTSPARARLSGRAAWGCAVGLVVAVAAGTSRAGPVAAPIAGGVPTTDHPAVAALVRGTVPELAVTDCTATLVGCRTLLTAAHCVCATTGAGCQSLPPPAMLAYFLHAGFVGIESIAVHPDYVYPVADVAVLRLAEPVTAIAPLGLNDVGTPPFGSAGTIVGFGWQTAVARDTGVMRAGAVTTAPCAGGISDVTSVCWDYTGAGANTCHGDSGGPLLIDLGLGPRVAGVTSGGLSDTCLPTDHSFDANVFVYRDWIASAAAGDLGTAGCGGVPAVGTPGARAEAYAGTFGTEPFALRSIGVAPGTTELRVALVGTEGGGADFDLYVRGAAPPEAGAVDCSATGPSQYGFCRIPDPFPGSWYLRAERVHGAGLYQLVATTIGGEPSICGNALREPGEDCDAADVGTCTTGCDERCSCIHCADTDLDVRQIELWPRLYVQAMMGDGLGTYTAVDPAGAGVTIELIDAAHTVPIVIPPRDPRWIFVNPRRGRYRWRGGSGAAVRRITFRRRANRPTTWELLVAGRHLPGTETVDYRTLLVRIRLGTRCAERRFHVTPSPPLLRAPAQNR
jgi:hypothetical protein